MASLPARCVVTGRVPFKLRCTSTALHIYLQRSVVYPTAHGSSHRSLPYLPRLYGLRVGHGYFEDVPCQGSSNTQSWWTPFQLSRGYAVKPLPLLAFQLRRPPPKMYEYICSPHASYELYGGMLRTIHHVIHWPVALL